MDVSTMNREFMGLCLPAKDNERPSKAARETTVEANVFAAEIPTGRMVYKYRVDIKKIRNEKETDLTRGIRSDVAVQHRRRVCRSLFEDALKKVEKEGKPWTGDKYTLVYDCGNILYSAEPLLCFANLSAMGDEKVVGVNLSPSEDISSDFSRRYVGEQSTVIVAVEPTLEFQTSMKEADESKETQQWLNVLTSGQLYKDGDHFVFGNKFYGKTSRNDEMIGEGKCIKPGFEKNSRIGDRNGRPVALIQLDAKKSPFFNGTNLVDLAKEILNVRSERDLENLDSYALRKLNSQLKGLVVKTLHTPKDKTRYFHIAGLKKDRVKDVEFEVEGKKTSLVDFFKKTYNYPLQHTRLPCVVEKGAKRESLYPMEVLEVERGQRVTSQKPGNQMAEKMIQSCRMNPGDLKAYIQNLWKESKIEKGGNKYLDAFGVKVSSKLEYVPGRVLYPPAINYGKSTVEPSRDGQMMWKLSREIFLKPATIDKIAFIIFDDCIKENLADQFMEKILKTAYEHGMTVPNGRDVQLLRVRSEDIAKLEDIFYCMKPNGPKTHYIWCVTKQKMDPVHDTMKQLEAKYGVVTQHVSQQILFKAIGQQGAYLVINNLVMKMNPKAGGVNHMVSLPRVFEEANRNDSQAQTRTFGKNRMIFGFDISHPGPQGFSDRALGVRQSEPSVVGMSYSMGCATEVRGVYWMQEPRFAGIEQLGRRVADALLDRLAECRNLPDDIVVYRGGVSEGEYDKVIMEMETLKEAFDLVGRPNYRPSLTCIVVLTNSNFRLFPERIDPRAKAFEQNVAPGTIVDSDITSPFYNEFILVSQRGILGTVRPTRCVIVATAEGSTGAVLKSNDAQLLTYSLAYGHQIVTGSTTLPLPLTAATALSNRGKNVWKEVNYHDAEARSALSGGSDGCLKHDGTDDFFAKMSDQLENKIKAHYWA